MEQKVYIQSIWESCAQQWLGLECLFRLQAGQSLLALERKKRETAVINFSCPGNHFIGCMCVVVEVHRGNKYYLLLHAQKQ